MEAILAPVPSWDAFPPDLAQLFQAFRTPDVGWKLIVDQKVFIEQVLPGGVVRKLSDAQMAAYREPFTEPASRKPVWRWPNEIPIAGEPPDVVTAAEAYNGWLQQTELPKLLFHATPGTIVPERLVAWCRQSLSHLDTVDLGQGRHFLQEDHLEAIGAAMAAWYAKL
jgi:haloalkane dehalogenase